MPPAEGQSADHDPKVLQVILTRAAPPDLELTFRPMFGGTMAYAPGKVFASLSNVRLALKLVGTDRDTLLAKPGARPLRYEPNQPPSKSYVVVPDTMLSDLAVLRRWIVRSAAGLPSRREGPKRQ